jgi:hypothetical protein
VSLRPYSAGAKRLLDEKGIRYVGGYDDLQELDRTEGVRTALLEAEQPIA